jgi:hypothetical protein
MSSLSGARKPDKKRRRLGVWGRELEEIAVRRGAELCHAIPRLGFSEVPQYRVVDRGEKALRRLKKHHRGLDPRGRGSGGSGLNPV